jgi:hypothetical protein
MTPYQLSISAGGEDHRNSLSAAMRNTADAFICSVLRYLAAQLTVFLGAGIAGNFLPSDLPSKSFAWGPEAKTMTYHEL